MFRAISALTVGTGSTTSATVLLCVVFDHGSVTCVTGIRPGFGPSVRVASDVLIFSPITTDPLWFRVDVDGREVIGGGIVHYISTDDEVTGVMGTTRPTSVVFMGTAPLV